jgi:hypothetical protein
MLPRGLGTPLTAFPTVAFCIWRPVDDYDRAVARFGRAQSRLHMVRWLGAVRVLLARHGALHADSATMVLQELEAWARSCLQ